MDETTENRNITTFYDKLRAKIVRESDQALARIDLAEAAARKIFEKGAAPAPNGAAQKAPRVRGARLDPAIKQAILATMSATAGLTIKEIAAKSKASKSQVRAALDIAIKDNDVRGDENKRNRRFTLTAGKAASNG